MCLCWWFAQSTEPKVAVSDPVKQQAVLTVCCLSPTHTPHPPRLHPLFILGGSTRNSTWCLWAISSQKGRKAERCCNRAVWAAVQSKLSVLHGILGAFLCQASQSCKREKKKKSQQNLLQQISPWKKSHEERDDVNWLPVSKESKNVCQRRKAKSRWEGRAKGWYDKWKSQDMWQTNVLPWHLESYSHPPEWSTLSHKTSIYSSHPSIAHHASVFILAYWRAHDLDPNNGLLPSPRASLWQLCVPSSQTNALVVEHVCWWGEGPVPCSSSSHCRRLRTGCTAVFNSFTSRKLGFQAISK